MVLDDFIAMIVADGHGTSGTNLFKGAMRAAPDEQVVVAEYAGDVAWAVFGVDVSDEAPGVQVKTRGKAEEYDAPRLLLEQIAQDLRARGAFTVNSTRYADLHQVQPVFPLGRDGNRRYQFGVNFIARKEPTSVP